ncbi:discoidin domain-containing protein [Pectobacterium brasiliense]|uniref:discoidin domain-containing protein n=2 Tax=Pectobacterium brasiliense TaxID=180957 RepID=UPI0015DFCE7A|nr:discoidin domain-containing protein [Pectobacterium brasiliense]MBA0197383.1 discoidin domain-containing protein [Pectobacterium brasiliense]MBN3095535.1 discoidin domain-containing protein [Pectobacterium brasiliense]MBN3140402.1 discoidin domain-containing protein [Pectobacterium brasiliense]
MKDINIEINVCDSTGKSTCTVHPHTCCHPDNGGGQEPGVSGVASVFGRTGVVTAQAGDYTADQITETATRKFATPDEKAVWNAKQDALISGTTIRTLFGQSLLGSGDFSPTPAQMGVAAADHTHTTADITDYTQKTKQLIHSSLEAGAGVTLSYNPVNEKTIISAAGGAGTGDSGYIVADRQGATAGQSHTFSVSSQNTFNLAAYALKEEAGAANQTYVVDDFGASSKANYDATDDIIFDGAVNLYRGGIYQLNSDGEFYSSEVMAGGKSLVLQSYTLDGSVVPAMSSNIAPSGQIISQSSSYNAAFMGWKAFDNNYTGDISRWSSLRSAPQWLSVAFDVEKTIADYSITHRDATNLGGNPTAWIFQGSADGVTWVDIDSRKDETFSPNMEKRITLTKPVTYRYYRVYVTAVSNGNFVTIQALKLFEPKSNILISSHDDYYTSANGILSSVQTPMSAIDIEDLGFSNSGVMSESILSSLLPIKVVSGAQSNIRTIYTPKSQIIIPHSLLSAAVSWSKINAATLTATQTGNGKVRVAVTRDLVNWYVLRNGAWVDVGVLSADTTGAEALIADGMTPAELGDITTAQWAQLFASNNGVPDSLAFAFALDITDLVTDVATIDRLVLNVNDVSSWKVQSPAEVEIRWRTDSVTFRTATAGNYKLAYQIP